MNRGVFPSQTDLALPLVSAGGQFLSSFTLSGVKRGNSQSAQPRAWNEIRVGILAAKPEAGRQAGRRAEREWEHREEADLCSTFPAIGRQSRRSPVTINLQMIMVAGLHSR